MDSGYCFTQNMCASSLASTYHVLYLLCIQLRLFVFVCMCAVCVYVCRVAVVESYVNDVIAVYHHQPICCPGYTGTYPDCTRELQ